MTPKMPTVPVSPSRRGDGGRMAAMAVGAVAAAAAWFAMGELGLSELMGINWRFGVWAAVSLGALVGLLGRSRWLVWPAAAAVAALLAVQWVPGPAMLVHAYFRVDSLPAEPVDAVVVLSAAVMDDGHLNGRAVDRLLEGIRLVRGGVSARLVLSRAEASVDGQSVTAEADQRALVALAGVEPELHLVSPATSTRSEALGTAALGQPLGWRTVVVVTSPSHSSRACATFEAVGFEVTCRPSADRTLAWEILSTPGDRALAFRLWVYETLGWAEYRARGWVGPRRRGRTIGRGAKASEPSGAVS